MECFGKAINSSHLHRSPKVVIQQSEGESTNRCIEPYICNLPRNKQGDPISSALFNAVLEEIMKPVKQKWSRKGWGVQVGWMTDEKLTNLRFADDVLLIARTLPQLKMMLQDIIDAANAVGLQLHPDKTKILHNSIGYGVGATSAKLRSMEIEILRGCQNAMYLGRMLKPTDMQNEELKTDYPEHGPSSISTSQI